MKKVDKYNIAIILTPTLQVQNIIVTPSIGYIQPQLRVFMLITPIRPVQSTLMCVPCLAHSTAPLLIWVKIHNVVGLPGNNYFIYCKCHILLKHFFWYCFTSSPECSSDLSVIFLRYLMHSEKVFLTTFLSQILSLWDIQCFLWDLLFEKFCLVWARLCYLLM